MNAPPPADDLPERDEEGFLYDPTLWSEGIAETLAREEELELTPERWQVVRYVRQHWEERSTVPEARTLLRHLKEAWGPERATRRYLYHLFPYGYGQQACKIAGMRKPRKLMLDV